VRKNTEKHKKYKWQVQQARIVTIERQINQLQACNLTDNQPSTT